jgi:hypothetical protein
VNLVNQVDPNIHQAGANGSDPGWNGAVESQVNITYIPRSRSRTGALLTMAELALFRPSCAICGIKIQSNVIHRNRTRYYCCREHYYEQRRRVHAYVQSRSGQKRARKVIASIIGPLPFGSIAHHHDGNTTHNLSVNLALFASQSDHMAHHHGNPNVVPLWDGAVIGSGR